MPSPLHEALVGMFRSRPSLAADLLVEALGIKLPEFQQVRLAEATFTDLEPPEYRADAVAVFGTDPPVIAVVIEVQLSPDPDKRWTWPHYLMSLRRRMRCPTMLLVVCPSKATAAWCATPYELGQPGLTMVPLVVGPHRVPVVTDADQARAAPELAVLSAIAHGRHAKHRAVLDALAAGLQAVDRAHATLYSDVVNNELPKAARKYLEELLSTRTYEYQSPFVRAFVYQGREEGREQGREQGRVEGEVNALLTVLAAKRIDVPEQAEARIRACADTEQLTTWIGRAATARTIADVLD